MSIRWKTLLALVVTGLIPMAAFVWFAQFTAYRGLRERILAQLQGFSQIQATRVAESLQHDRDRLALVCSRTQLRLTLASQLQQPAPEKLEKIERILTDARNSIPKFQRISVAGLDGAVVGSTDPQRRGERLPAGEAFDQALAGNYGAELRGVPADPQNPDGAEKLAVLLCGPLNLEGQLIGVAAVWSDAANLTRLLENQQGLGRGGKSRLLALANADGGGGEGEARSLVPLGPANRPTGLQTSAGVDFLHETQDGLHTHALDKNAGTALLAAVERVPDSRLAVLTHVERDVALASALSVRNLGLSVAAAGLAAMLFVALILSRSVTRPVRRLSAAATRIAQGHLDERADVRSSDEIGELAQDFNQMTEQLVEANRDLERKIEERTKELESTQMLLIQSEKLDSLGRLAAGVAHEVKNPLQIIRMGIDYYGQTRDSLDEDQLLMLETMSEGLDRADEIVQGMVDLSRADGLNLKPTKARDLFRQALVLVGHRLRRKNIQVVEDFQQNLPEISADVRKMEQVLINLINNAADATENGGTVTLRTFSTQLSDVVPDHGLRRFERLRANDQVVILEVRDTGPGIPEENLRKLFDPFFTTKPTGEGTGLGLGVSKTIVDLHYGNIEIENVDDPPGARARVFLKIPARPTTGAESNLTEKPKQTHGRTQKTRAGGG